MKSSPINKPDSQILDESALNHIESFVYSSEWKNGNSEFMRQAYSGLFELLKSQCLNLKEVERQVASRASRSELNSGLNIKSNLADMMRCFQDLQAKIDLKAGVEELNDKASLKDLERFTNPRNLGQVIEALNSKVAFSDFDNFSQSVQKLMEAIDNRQVNIESEFEGFRAEVDLKPTIEEVNAALNTKASKTSVIEALHRKCNKSDFDLLEQRLLRFEGSISEKLNQIENNFCERVSEIQTTITEKLNEKADCAGLKVVHELLYSKLDLTEFQAFKDSQHGELKSKLSDCQYKIDNHQQKISELDSDIDRLIKSIKADMSVVNKTLLGKTDKLELISEIKSLRELTNNLDKKSFDLTSSTTQLIEKRFLHFESGVLKNLTVSKESNEKTFEQIYSRIEEAEAKLQKLNRNFAELEGDKQSLFKSKDDSASKLKYLESMFNVLDDGIKSTKLEMTDFINGQIDLCKDHTYQMLSSQKSLIDEFITDYITDYERTVKDLILKIDDTKSSLGAELNSFTKDLSRLQNSIQEVNDRHTSILNTINLKLDKSAFDLYLKSTTSLFQDLASSGGVKKKIDSTPETVDKPILNALKAKADVEDVNKALNSVYHELDSKVNTIAVEDEFGRVYSMINNISSITNSLSSSLHDEGKWEWNSSTLNSGLAVKWDTEIINTSAGNNYRWTSGKSYIEIICPGIHKLDIFVAIRAEQPKKRGYEEMKDTMIQILLDGEPISIKNIQNEQLKDENYIPKSDSESISREKDMLKSSSLDFSQKALTKSLSMYSSSNRNSKLISFTESIEIHKQSKLAICVINQSISKIIFCVSSLFPRAYITDSKSVINVNI